MTETIAREMEIDAAAAPFLSGAVDAVALTQALIRRPSVTPAEAGALALLARILAARGFVCERIDVEGIANLYARRGGAGPTFCFGGHTDVVPVGEAAAWTADPFGGEIRDGRLWGRGATDMKSGVAAFVSAACAWADASPDPRGALSLLITGDEEGDAVHGTRAALERLAARGERIDAALVGEPTSAARLGDVMKVGRRGSLTGYLRVIGTQGHTAYPHRANNPLPALARLLDQLATEPLDEGQPPFEPSTLALATIDVGNPANNVIPAEGRATFNVRFNDLHTAASLTERFQRRAADVATAFGVRIELEVKVSGEAFVTAPGALTDIVAEAVIAETGVRPEATTGGGTSDARFFTHYAPVVELGLVGDTMHQVDERVAVEDIPRLAAIYRRVIDGFFAAQG